MNIDIPTQFNRPSNLDSGLAADLSRLGSAVEQIHEDPEVARVPDTALANGNITLAIDFVTYLTLSPSGQVIVLLPAPSNVLANVQASLVITKTTSANVLVRAPKGSKLNGQASLTFTAGPHW